MLRNVADNVPSSTPSDTPNSLPTLTPSASPSSVPSLLPSSSPSYHSMSQHTIVDSHCTKCKEWSTSPLCYTISAAFYNLILDAVSCCPDIDDDTRIAQMLAPKAVATGLQVDEDIDPAVRAQANKIVHSNDKEPTGDTTCYGEPPGDVTDYGSMTTDGEPTVATTDNGEPYPAQTENFSSSSPPFAKPSVQPSSKPNSEPSSLPSASPSVLPSPVPSAMPSAIPSSTPSLLPSYVPSATPSATTSTSQSPLLNLVPSSSPSGTPSYLPAPTLSAPPSFAPSMSPMFGNSKFVINASTMPHAESHERHPAVSFYRLSKALMPRVVPYYNWHYKRQATAKFTTYWTEHVVSLASTECSINFVHVDKCTSSSRWGVTIFRGVRDSMTPEYDVSCRMRIRSPVQSWICQCSKHVLRNLTCFLESKPIPKRDSFTISTEPCFG